MLLSGALSVARAIQPCFDTPQLPAQIATGVFIPVSIPGSVPQ
jgi:hypothetical protein